MNKETRRLSPKRIVKAFAAALLVTIVVASGTLAYRYLDDLSVQQGFPKVKVGATKEEVIRLMGKPSEISPGHGMYSEYWSYYELVSGQYLVDFGLDGRVLTRNFGPWNPFDKHAYDKIPIDTYRELFLREKAPTQGTSGNSF